MKPENILLDKNNRAYVADLGVARIYERFSLAKNPKLTATLQGTENWMAPEMRNAFEKNLMIQTDMTKLDVFSLGLIALYAFDYENFQKLKVNLNLEESKLKEYLDRLEKSLDEDCFVNKKRVKPTKSYFYYIKTMLSFETIDRPNIIEVYEDLVKVCEHKMTKLKIINN